MATESSATTTWQGSLTKGSGTTHPQSGAFPDVEVTWASRTARTAGKTSPEELLAAAHASCYCMALSNELSGAGNEPEQCRRPRPWASTRARADRIAHRRQRPRAGHRTRLGFEEAGKRRRT